MDISFSEFKDNFYKKVENLDIFNVQDFNILKVVLDGLQVDYASKGDLRVFINKSTFSIKSFFALKRMKLGSIPDSELKNMEKFRGIKVVFRGGIFLNDDGSEKSRIFQPFLEQLPREEILFVKNTVPDIAGKEVCDIGLYKIIPQLQYRKLDESEEQLLTDLRNCIQELEKESIFSQKEILSISFAVQKFFLEYRVWKFFFDKVKPTKMCFRCHYHFEGMMLAAKRAGVRTIELQHGLIASQDIFYMLPKQVKRIAKKALFADEIWLYGNKWKKNLVDGAEYSEDQMKIVGYYMENDEYKSYDMSQVLEETKGRKIILITTQTGSHKDFISYTEGLKTIISKEELWDEYIVIVKPHPNEPIGIYDKLLEESKVILFTGNLDAVLNITEYLISIYSTTILEAARFGVKCFSLFVDYRADYVSEFVDKGYSMLIEHNQAPFHIKSDEFSTGTQGLFEEINVPLIQELTE